jgi:hypothetical protein
MGDRWVEQLSQNEVWRYQNPFPVSLEELDTLGSMDSLNIYGSLDDLDDLDIILPALTWSQVSTGSERWTRK